ncbi:TM1266 family iron-only hydrogenase system putative regulator [Maridesulfovibrio sp.]|uniref:TM1266 family iron-only hydrogenase system putative regulator n=1 Tax=Maridesulfovibrio sp. TaxID=2795000 RepID=UPI002A187EC0|nr:TM1266 family iron-only hydrogenase system putative regulator [Maridesulfovibrio sp.]
MDKRLGIIGITIKDRYKSAPKVNRTLSEHGDIIVGRMGLPFRDKGVNVIGLIIEATTDEVGALTGQLGMLQGVKVKSLLV